MFTEKVMEDMQEMAENSAYLSAVERKDVSMDMYHQLPPYEELGELESQLVEENAITFDKIFHEPCGYYNIKNFLIADYSVDRAIFIKDVEKYRNMRFESARKRVAKILYERFVAQEGRENMNYPAGVSVFQIIHMQNRQQAQREQQLQQQQQQQLNGTASALSTSREASGDDGKRGSTTVSQNAQSISVSAGSAVDRSGSTSTEETKRESLLQMGTTNNPLGVYGRSVQNVKDIIARGEAPKDLFDEVAKDVMNDLKLDVFPRFCKSDFYRRYIRCKYIETVKVSIRDFTTFRVLGRGGFGAVHACRKNNSGAMYAMKCVNKKLVKVKAALDNVLEERNVLMMMQSTFVTNLKYALQDEDNLYLIMDLMLGGDLKFHLIQANNFTEKRAQFYAAQVLLGLEHVHSKNVIYRDMKLENVLLDHSGHSKLSDLGLAVITKVKIKGYAGTPGYTSPEMIKNKLYGPATDIFSYGVMLYRMLCGAKPFKGKAEVDLDKAVVEKKPQFPADQFSRDAIHLLNGMLQKKPEVRLGCGDRGIEEIKEHPFFASIDWGLLEAGYVDPPFVPNKFDVNAASLKDIGDFDKTKYKQVKLDDKFKQRIKDFGYVSLVGLQEELVAVLEKVDENKNFERFAPVVEKPAPPIQPPGGGCCETV